MVGIGAYPAFQQLLSPLASFFGALNIDFYDFFSRIGSKTVTRSGCTSTNPPATVKIYSSPPLRTVMIPYFNVVKRGEWRSNQGKRILIHQAWKTNENLEQVSWLPTGEEAFTLDTSFAGFLLLE
ncbi:MAG TPA: hypothetical protein VLH85_07055 [Levilinea sp.]|nr:hypothetical protein [Levilinea sp.]